MKKIIILIIIFSAAILSADTIIPSGDVSGNWSLPNSPYLIEGEITVPNAETLSIEPGVQVEFQGHYKFHIQGRLLAIGTSSDIITFTINDTTNFHDMNLQEGAWQGIRFNNTPATNDSSKIVFCKIEYGKANGFDPPCSGNGGALYVENFSKLLVQNSEISSNKAMLGGGIALDSSNGVVFKNTIISNNESTGDGGGMYLIQSNPVLDGIIFDDNDSSSGGGMACWYDSSPTVSNSNFLNNNGGVHGGGIYCKFGSSPDLIDVVFRENISSYGAAANFNDESNPRIVRVLIENNHATNSSGAFSCGYNSHPKIINSTIVNNTADGNGGVSYIYDSHPVFVNSIIWNNEPEAFYFSDWDEFVNSITVANSDVEGGTNSIVNSEYATINWLSGNIDADPQFMNANNDFNLNSNSPCIDSGIDFFEWNSEVLVDLGFDEYFGAAPDMGVYEYGFTNIENEEYQISNFNLRNFPNPFRTSTTIYFDVAQTSRFVTIEIYNIKGQKVRSFSNRQVSGSSKQKVFWDGKDENNEPVSGGIYYYRLQNRGISQVRKMILMK